MTWPNGTIRLNAARSIFIGAEFEEIKIDEKTVGYRATWNELIYEKSSLTELCQHLWKIASTFPEG